MLTVIYQSTLHCDLKTALNSIGGVNLLLIDRLWAAVAAVGVARVGGNMTVLDVGVVGHGHAWTLQVHGQMVRTSQNTVRYFLVLQLCSFFKCDNFNLYRKKDSIHTGNRIQFITQADSIHSRKQIQFIPEPDSIHTVKQYSIHTGNSIQFIPGRGFNSLSVTDSIHIGNRFNSLSETDSFHCQKQIQFIVGNRCNSYRKQIQFIPETDSIHTGNRLNSYRKRIQFKPEPDSIHTVNRLIHTGNRLNSCRKNSIHTGSRFNSYW